MKVVIAGVGYTGLAVARTFRAAGWEVIGLTHSAESAAKLSQEFPCSACDISDNSSLKLDAPYEARKPDVVIHCASSSHGGADAYNAVYLQGCRNLASVLSPTRLLFTSSTSVYAQTDGGVVDEFSDANPPRETGRLLRDTEEFVLSIGGSVARLAGIYGPGRSVLLRKFFSGEAVIEGDGQRVNNQIHRDDIATALLTIAQQCDSAMYNVCDNLPMPQLELYTWLSEKFSRPLPPNGPIDPNRKRGWTSKRVSNARLRGLGWAPAWPTFFDAVSRDEELVRLAQLA